MENVKSKFTQHEISSGRRLYNYWKQHKPEIDFWSFLNEETKKGFADSIENHDVPPFNIVRS